MKDFIDHCTIPIKKYTQILRMVWMVNNYGIITHFQLKIKKGNYKRNEKWRMNENVEKCEAIYSLKTLMDCNYSDMKHLKCAIRPKMN